jgi:HSP20 family protein
MTKEDNKKNEIDKYGHFGFPKLRDFSYMPKFFREMDKWFSDFETLPSMPEIFNNKYRWALTEWKDEDKKYVGLVELPGMKKEEIKVRAFEDGLEIIAEQYEKKEENGSTSEIRRNFRTYERLPKNADLEHIDASYNNGVLTLDVPKLDKPNKNDGLEIKIN